MAGATQQLDLGALVKRGDVDAINEFLATINSKTDQINIINTASASGSTCLFGACWDGRLDIVDVLVRNGAKINWKNVRGNTAMAMAIEQNHVDIVEYLLKAGATCTADEVNEIRVKTKKPIEKRIDELVVEYQTAKALTDALAATTLKSTGVNARYTLLNELLQLVLSNSSAEFAAKMSEKKYREVINDIDTTGTNDSDIQTDATAAANQPNNLLSQPLLFHAASRGHNEIIQSLLKYNVNMDYRDRAGRSALHMSIASNLYATTKLLLDAGANTTGIDMRQIRFWSSSNITTRIDNLLKKYPPKPLKVSKRIKSSLEGLSLKEYKLQDKIFRFFDTNNDGFISEAELRAKLKQTHRGPAFDAKLIHDMIKVANSYNHAKGVSFEQFVDILSDAAEQTKENTGTSGGSNGRGSVSAQQANKVVPVQTQLPRFRRDNIDIDT